MKKVGEFVNRRDTSIAIKEQRHVNCEFTDCYDFQESERIDQLSIVMGNTKLRGY